MTRIARARVYVASLAGLGAGLALSPWPWLGLAVPAALLFAIALIAPEVES